MTQYFAPRASEVFVLSEGHGDISREEYVLKTDAAVYDVGTLVISEYAVNAKTGKYVRATQTLVDAQAGADFAIVLEATDARAADVKAAVFVRLGVVKARELVLDVSITTAEAAALLLKQFVVVR
ncbi:head decoration protein [Rhizobium johnstonii]|uniref:head decoration protein n=1 Tax=Rhizobium johnstonii TaxID=3019933 RepID=UPI003F989743